MKPTKNILRQLNRACNEYDMFASVRDGLLEGLGAPPSRADEQFTLYLTIGQFQELYGFYGSELLMRHMAAMYSARVVRFILINEGIDPTISEMSFDLLMSTNATEEKVAVKLVRYFTERFGSVSPERIKEIDDLVISWEAQSTKELLDEL